MQDQFTPKRMVGLLVAFAVMFAFIIYMQAGVGTMGAPPPPTGDEWSTYLDEAIYCTLLIFLITAAVVALTLRKAKPQTEPQGGRS